VRLSQRQKENKVKKPVLLFFILLTLSGCHSSKDASTGEHSPGLRPTIKPVHPVSGKTGAYEEIGKESPIAVKTFGFLKETLADKHPSLILLSVKKAKSQVVEGLNIKLLCEYRAGKDETPGLLLAKVYWDLDGHPSLEEVEPEYTKEF
jgi:hypothetical protein